MAYKHVMAAVDLSDGLTAMGLDGCTRALTSGLHLIAIGAGLQGGADPRREGIAFGK